MSADRTELRALPAARAGRSRRLIMGTVACVATALSAQDPTATRRVDLDPVVVTVTRSPQAAARLPVTVDVFTADDFAANPSLAIDDVLKSSAAFSLFRRTSSLMSHPTAQGVSLRNLGPSGASRTLVLLDGVPLNDPFGGWVAWTKLPRLNIAGAEIVRGGSSSAWGSAALGGTIQMLTTPQQSGPAEANAAEAMPSVRNSAVRLHGEVGDFHTRSGEMLVRHDHGRHRLDVAARAFATDGFWRVGAADRGLIDRRLDSDHQLAQIGWTYRGAAGLEGGVRARVYREERGNGTPYQRNRSEEAFVAGQLAGRLPTGLSWNAHTYLQTQDFSSGFSAISADRSTETPSLDQYSVPADAAGAVLTGTWQHESSATTTVGGDVRWVRGETREAFFFQQNTFTRWRIAGGEQTLAGVFAQHDRAFAAGWRAQLGLRGDTWRNHAGRRREIETASGSVLRDERFTARDGVELSPSVGLVWRANDQLRWRAAAYRAFRVPTLNELYRPFRVGAVNTEANAALTNETLDGAELGTNITIGSLQFAATGFVNQLHDAVANVTIGTGPGTFPGIGFVPAGVVGRQRRNLDEVRVRGFEVSARWDAPGALVLRAEYLFSDATVRSASAPADVLIGRRLAQVPRHTVTAAAEWRPVDRWRWRLQLRHVSSASEDDANTLTLAPATTLDTRLAHTFGRQRAGEIFLSLENLASEVVETGRDANGRTDFGSPSYLHGGLTWTW